MSMVSRVLPNNTGGALMVISLYHLTNSKKERRYGF
jgi:hypothetical protein